MSRREAQNPRLSITVKRISTANEPCILVITTLITGLSIAHVMRGVNPHYGGILGDNFIPGAPYK